MTALSSVVTVPLNPPLPTHPKSVQYLQFPEKVFEEVYRVLKPGGVAIFSFSNRMFYQKAIAVRWLPERYLPVVSRTAMISVSACEVI